MTDVALITGASSGIGEATARLLSVREPRAEIVLVARRRDRVDALADELNVRDGHRHVHAYAADLTDAGAVDRLATHVRTHFGRLNLLINNAGAGWSQPFAQGGYANVAQTMAINFDAQVQVTEAMLPLLRTAAAADGAAEPTVGGPATGPRASIVNVASVAGRISRPGAGAYSASKAALIGWSDALHGELGPEGIHVGLVNPGFIATEGFPHTEFVSHPLKRRMVGTPEQAAEAILQAGLEGRAEIYVPAFYWLFAALRTLAPGVIRRAVGQGAFTSGTRTGESRQ